MQNVIRVGSRTSKLAVIQSELVMQQIQAICPDTTLELVTMTTIGDQILDKTLDKIGGKGLFLRELEKALLEKRVDLCVHSLKDVPVEGQSAISIGAYSKREAAADVLVLPKGAKEWDKKRVIGCASTRRAMQLQMLYPDVTVKPIRGNVLTRLEKLDRGEYGALILAEAGLIRLGLMDRISYRFSVQEMIPSAGQGILAIQTRVGEYTSLLTQLNDPISACCAKIERKLSQLLGGDCSAPVGCYAEIVQNTITLYGFSGIGSVPRKASVRGKTAEAEHLILQLAKQLQV